MKLIKVALADGAAAILAALTLDGVSFAIAAGLLVLVGILLIVRGRNGGGER